MADSAEWKLDEHVNKARIESLYDIGDELGSGSFSVVKKAVEKSTGKEYACKIIDRELVADKMEMVNIEVRILQLADHKNIVNMKEMFDQDGKFWLVLELVTGGELFDRIVQLQFYSEEDAAKVVYQVLAGIAHFHDRNIIHRDLKPENLLLASEAADADTKLADFGLSYILPDAKTLLKKAVGTPGYIAPEVLLALEGGDGYAHPADVWGVGVILYILLCGFPPFYDEDEEALFDSIIDAQFSYPSPYWDEVSEPAKDLINKMLTKDPTKRVTAKEAMQHPWLQGAAKKENLSTAVEELKKFRARQKFKGAILGVMALGKLNFGKALPKAGGGGGGGAAAPTNPLLAAAAKAKAADAAKAKAAAAAAADAAENKE